MVEGQCVVPEPDKCESTVGNNVDHMHRMGDFTGAGVVGGYVPPPGVVCDGGCQYASNQQPAKDAFRFVNGDPSGVYGAYGYKGNGVSCTGGEATREQPANGSPTAEKTSECTNKVTDAEGRQQYSCTAVDSYTDIGSMDCGEVNGVHQCVPVPPKPRKTDKTTEVEVTEKTNPDGSKDTTTTTTTTTTVCSGVNACTTTTTTSTTSNHTKSDGSPGGESTSCTGPGCPDGDGKTQQEREQEEEEEQPESKVSGGQTCEAAPTCEGDAVQCAILKQQYEARCDYEEAMDYDGKKADIEGLFQGEQFELQESEISAPSFINSATRFLPSGCPPPESITLTSNGGHTFQLKYEPICRIASDFSWLIVAFTSLFSALYVGRAFGGE
ncbi:virulence factor TspB C-terminal domain-related protein [Pseudomonas benzenivorans]|nr:virulence factor TspB C-terminal domain-related protein [Pseudomonas benzenivorans]